jgi:hypothetical protein
MTHNIDRGFNLKNQRLRTGQKPALDQKKKKHTAAPPNETGRPTLLRHFKFTLSPDQRLSWLRLSIALALICGFCLSWRLWVSYRFFPRSPVVDWLPEVPFPLDRLWFYILIILLVTISIFRRRRSLIIAFTILAGLLSLWDQTRWQPWFYQYVLMLAVIGLHQLPGEKSARNICRTIVIFTYFWSGVQKLNANFAKEAWPDIARPVLSLLPHSIRELPAFLILSVPVIEITIALGLITRRFRDAAAVLAIVTHAFVLVLLLRSGENIVVWPWNVAMIVFVMILFCRDKNTSPREILVPANGFHALALLLFAILPVLSFFDLWDSYLSSARYSGNTDQAVMYVTPAVIERLPPALRPHIWQTSKPFFLDINRWSYSELNVPLYPEPRVYKAVAKKICEYAGDSLDIKLRIKEKPSPLTTARESQFYDCDHL